MLIKNPLQRYLHVIILLKTQTITKSQSLPMDKWNVTDELCVTAVCTLAKNVTDTCVAIHVTYDAYELTGRRSSIVNNSGS